MAIEANQEYTDNAPDWEQIQTCLKGERFVKKEKDKYLPYPVVGIDQTTIDFTNTYTLYLEGAHYVNFVEESRTDLVNSAFREDPTITPKDDDVSLLASSKKLVSAVTSFGRAFVFADYPAEFPEGTEPHAYILIYEPLDVLDWATNTYSGDQSLQYVLLRELNTFDTDETFQYRELLIEDNIYKVRVKEKQDSEDYEEFIPTQSNGKHFNVIPGTFCGANDNDPNVDQSPILGISNSNIKHYQTWAELTSATVYLGSPTLALTGLPSGFIKQMEKNDAKIKVGANLALALEGDSAQASLLEINSDLTHYKTLEKLEASMSEQGFQLRANMTRGGAETASTVQLRQASQMSKLGTIVNNCEDALNQTLIYAAEYTGGAITTIELNKDFFPSDICSLEAPQTIPTTQTSQPHVKSTTMD